MIYAEAEKAGAITVSGPMDIVLTEYTALTRLVMYQLKRDFGEEVAYKIVADLGKIAAKNIDSIASDLQEMQDEVFNTLEEGVKNEI